MLRSATEIHRPTTGRIAALLVVAAIMAACLAAAPSAQAAYNWYESDGFAHWDSSGSRVYVKGDVDWYWDRQGYNLTVFRGQFRQGSYVILGQSGCLWVKVEWEKVGLNFSWPPSGTVGRASNGYYRKCGPRGTYLWLTGISHASRLLTGVVLSTGYSSNTDPDVVRWETWKRMNYGGA
jgi:hypothetical protein